MHLLMNYYKFGITITVFYILSWMPNWKFALKGEKNAVSVHIMKAYGRGRIAPLIPNLSTRLICQVHASAALPMRRAHGPN
jgi:hypothetical protein